MLHQGLAFRGHELEASKNKGNFRELVWLLAKQNEKNKKLIFRNVQMVSPDIQREIANCFAEVRKKMICCFG
jgi:citrate synthase